MADDGPLQLSLFDQQDLAEITSPDFPGERLIACATRSWPPTAPAPARTCSPPPRTTWPPLLARVAGKLTRAGPIGVNGQGDQQVQDHKRFQVTITDATLAMRAPAAGWTRSRPGRVLRVGRPVPASEFDAPTMVTAYKNLEYVERTPAHQIR